MTPRIDLHLPAAQPFLIGPLPMPLPAVQVDDDLSAEEYRALSAELDVLGIPHLAEPLCVYCMASFCAPGDRLCHDCRYPAEGDV